MFDLEAVPLHKVWFSGLFQTLDIRVYPLPPGCERRTNWHDLLSTVNKDHFNKPLLQLIYNILTETSAEDQICDKNIFYLVIYTRPGFL